MSLDLTDQIFNICTRANTYPYTFCSSKGRFAIELSMKGDLQLNIAPILPNVSKTPQKGEKRYNEDLKAFITLSPDNIIHILKHLPFLKNGSYENPDKNCDPRYKKSLAIIHPAPPGSNRPASLITFSLLPNDPNPDKIIVFIKSQEGKTGSYMLSNSPSFGGTYSLTIFEGILRKVATDGAYDILLQKSFLKVINTAIYKIRESANGGGNQQGNYKQKNNYNNSNYNQAHNPQYNQHQQPQQPQYNQQPPQYNQPAPPPAAPQYNQPHQPQYTVNEPPPQYQNVVTQNQPPNQEYNSHISPSPQNARMQNTSPHDNGDIDNMFSDEELGL